MDIGPRHLKHATRETSERLLAEHRSLLWIKSLLAFSALKYSSKDENVTSIRRLLVDSRVTSNIVSVSFNDVAQATISPGKLRSI